jgi:hypothetical protein
MKQQEEKEFKELFSALETEQPSMRFTKNVMDSIEGMQVVSVSKRYVNPWVVKAILGVLILTLLVSGTYIYIIADSTPALNSSQLKLFTEQTSGYLSLIAFANIILLLVFAEHWMSSKRRIQQLQRLNQL